MTEYNLWTVLQSTVEKRLIVSGEYYIYFKLIHDIYLDKRKLS